VPNAVRRFARKNYPVAVEIVENETMWLVRKTRSLRDRIEPLVGRGSQVWRFIRRLKRRARRQPPEGVTVFTVTEGHYSHGGLLR
jgi:hypothetical protein